MKCRHVVYVRNVYSDHKLYPLWYVEYNNYTIVEKDEYIEIYWIKELFRLSNSTKSIVRYFISVRDKIMTTIESIRSEIRSE